MSARDFTTPIAVLKGRASTLREAAAQPRVAGHQNEQEWRTETARRIRDAEACERAIKLLELHNEFESEPPVLENA